VLSAALDEEDAVVVEFVEAAADGLVAAEVELGVDAEDDAAALAAGVDEVEVLVVDE